MGDKLRCKLCFACFESSNELKNHIASEIGLDSDLFSFLDIDLGINEGFEVEKTENACKKCNKIFKSKQGLTQHIGKVHNKQRRYASCALCEKTFRNKYALRFHVKQVHETTLRKKCPHCHVVFYNKYALSKHMAHSHN